MISTQALESIRTNMIDNAEVLTRSEINDVFRIAKEDEVMNNLFNSWLENDNLFDREGIELKMQDRLNRIGV